MRKSLTTIAMTGLIAVSLPVMTVAASAQEGQTTAAGHYSVESTLVGTLLDDPAAAAVLQKLIPDVYANDMFKTMGRSQTLKAIQQYEPVGLSDANLAKIQAEFEKLPAKK